MREKREKEGNGKKEKEGNGKRERERNSMKRCQFSSPLQPTLMSAIQQEKKIIRCEMRDEQQFITTPLHVISLSLSLFHSLATLTMIFPLLRLLSMR